MVADVRIKYTDQITSNNEEIDLICAKIAHFMVIFDFCDLDLDLQTDN